MAHDRFAWLRRIKAVEREHAASRLGIDRLLSQAREEPSLLRGDVTLRDLAVASGRLDGTYVIRLFAEFETALRLFWLAARKTDPPGRTRDADTARGSCHAGGICMAAAPRHDANGHSDAVAFCNPSAEVASSPRNRILLFFPATDCAFAVAAQRTI